MNRAVFLDRDGVLNRLVYNPQTGEYESPNVMTEFELYPWTLPSLQKLSQMGFLLFLISNQPNYAKGKTPLENLKQIHERFHQQLSGAAIHFSEYYYCFHHPNGIVPEFTRVCECRKPKPFFVLQAKARYDIDLPGSWCIGDRDSDIFCGQAAELRTILISEAHSINYRGKSAPDFSAENLEEAVQIISNEQNKQGTQ